MTSQFQPTIVKYPKDSYIIVEGKSNTDRFFIIQEGKARIIREVDAITQQDSTVAGPGDIIAVVSVMASFSSIESVVALTDLTLLAIERSQYGNLIRAKTPIAIKIIQQFSQRLRSLDETLSKRALSNAGTNDPTHLLQVADYYAKQRKVNQAFYVYQQYLLHCPNASNFQEIRTKLDKLSSLAKDLKPVYMPDKVDRTYPKDCLLFAEGEIGHEAYIIQKGSIKISKIVDNQEVVLAVLKKGDIFGEMSLLEDKPRMATAETCEECTVLMVNRANFEGLIKVQPDMVARLTTLMAERIWLSYKQLSNTLIADPLGRLYDALLIQLEKDRVAINAGQSHLCNFGFKELAGMAGIPSGESNLLLRKFFANKQITLKDGKIFVVEVIEVLKQTEFYKRTQQRLGTVRGGPANA